MTNSKKMQIVANAINHIITKTDAFDSFATVGIIVQCVDALKRGEDIHSNPDSYCDRLFLGLMAARLPQNQKNKIVKNEDLLYEFSFRMAEMMTFTAQTFYDVNKDNIDFAVSQMMSDFMLKKKNFLAKYKPCVKLVTQEEAENIRRMGEEKKMKVY